MILFRIQKAGCGTALGMEGRRGIGRLGGGIAAGAGVWRNAVLPAVVLAACAWWSRALLSSGQHSWMPAYRVYTCGSTLQANAWARDGAPSATATATATATALCQWEGVGRAHKPLRMVEDALGFFTNAIELFHDLFPMCLLTSDTVCCNNCTPTSTALTIERSSSPARVRQRCRGRREWWAPCCTGSSPLAWQVPSRGPQLLTAGAGLGTGGEWQSGE